MHLVVIDRTPNDGDEPADNQLPEGAISLGHAAGVEWHRIPDGETPPEGSREPTEQELAAALLELPAIRQLKAATRRKIESEMGDLHEIVADQSKQIEALTALVCRMAAEQLGGTAMDAATKATYLARVEMVVGALDSGALVLRGDQEGADDMLARVLARTSRVNQIVGEEYLPRRNELLS
jgi:hypothetical protein